MADILATIYQTGFSGVTNDDIKSFTGKTLSIKEQTECDSIISSLESYIAKQCRRNFLVLPETDVYYQVFDAGENEYLLKSFPINEVTKVTVNDTIIYEKNGESNQYVLGQSMFVDNDRVLFLTAPQSSVHNFRALKIYYTIQNVVGEDMKLAIKQWASDIFLNREVAGKSLTNFTASGISTGYDSKSIPTYVNDVISSYKKILI